MNEPIEVSVIIPTLNESANLQPLVDGVNAALVGMAHEVIIVDDDSPDGTWQKAETLATSRPWLRVIRRQGPRGLSLAVLEGFAAARGTLLAVMDADLSHDEKILPELIADVRAGADMAVGSRRVPGGGATAWPWYRRWTSNLATAMAQGLLRLPLADPMSGYFVISRQLYAEGKDRLNPLGYKILLELYAKTKPKRIVERPFIFRDRRQGHSKLTPRVMWQYLQMVWALYRKRK